MSVVQGRATIFEEQAATIRADVYVPGGPLLAPEEVSSISLKVFDLSLADPTVPSYEVELPGASGLILKDPVEWEDREGSFNFSSTIWPQTFPMSGGHQYRWEYRINTPNYGRMFVFAIVTCKSLMGS